MTFRPPLWRCCIVFFTRWFFSTLIGLLFLAIIDTVLTRGEGWSDPSDFIGPAVFLIGGLLGTWKTPDRLSITLSDDHVSGLNGKWWRWGRVDLPLDKLDRERTCRQTVGQRLFSQRYGYLWSTDGHKIPIDYWAFTPAQVTALLRLIGCEEDQSGSSITNEH